MKGASAVKSRTKSTPTLVDRQEPEVKPLTRFQRKSLNIAVSVAAYLLTTTAIFYVANRLLDVGMDRVVEDES